MVKEKKHRLDLGCYEGEIRASFTLCIQGRKQVFITSDIVKNFATILEDSAKKHSCVNWIYLFMPDHFHCVLHGTNSNANIWKSIVLFKQKTGYWFSKNMPATQWQKDFFDYVHRKETELQKHIFYILNNPVRAGIVNKWQDYRFKGALDFNLEDLG